MLFHSNRFTFFSRILIPLVFLGLSEHRFAFFELFVQRVLSLKNSHTRLRQPSLKPLYVVRGRLCVTNTYNEQRTTSFDPSMDEACQWQALDDGPSDSVGRFLRTCRFTVNGQRFTSSSIYGISLGSRNLVF
jgi:hypothetical protein